MATLQFQNDTTSQEMLPTATKDNKDAISITNSSCDDVDSRCSNSTHENEEPPDGGLLAWTQVLAAHLLVFSGWGYVNSFGIFQSYYAVSLGLPPSTISWIGGLQTCLVFLVGAVSGRAHDAGYLRPALALGCGTQVLALFTTSLCTRYWQLILAQGVCQGLGFGVCFTPAIALVSTYFKRRRSLAISMVASGAATGGVAFPFMAQQLLARVGFAWTVRAIGFVVIFNSTVALALVRSRLPPRTSGPLLELSAFKEKPYALFTLGMWFVLWATYIAYYFARPFALDILHSSPSTSFTILLILNFVGVPGRLVPAYIADKMSSPVVVLIPFTFAGAICLFSWTAVSSLTGHMVWVVVYGFVGAAIQGLFPASLSSLCRDPAMMGTRIGMVLSVSSIACLTGPPMAGKLIQATNGKYLAAQLWSASCLLLGGLIVTAAHLVNRSEQKAREKSSPQLSKKISV